MTTLSPSPSAAISLLNAKAVRERVELVMTKGRAGELASLEVIPGCMEQAVRWVLDECEHNYPDYQIPPHGCWRSFETGGMDRWSMLAGAREFETAEDMLKSAGDLAVVTAVMNVALRPSWSYSEAVSGNAYSDQQGRALAVLSMFAAGTFSAMPEDPLRVDAHALIRLESAEIAAGLQLDADDDLEDITKLSHLLKRLGEAIGLRPDLFERNDEIRPGCLMACLAENALDGQLDASAVLDAVLEGLTPLWQGGAVLDDVILGDAWQHSSLFADLPAAGVMPFHLPALEVVYSLIEPFALAGIGISGLEELPGLADIDHAALFIACGAIKPRLEKAWLPLDGAIELRAVCLGLSAELADELRSELDVDRETLPLTCVLEAGSSRAGRKILRENPLTSEKAAKILGGGGVFWLPFRA
ncbi:DUF1688 family protein [Roseibium algae]|uniref:DUF1688 family protein n=1 Tax=Roseibium algae TaxID=3123038 RepID=A0ABU8TPW1_9HYPH